MEQRNTLALSMRWLHGKNVGYVPARGLRARNLIWIHAMTAAILGALQAFLFCAQKRPDRVRVFLNAKAMSPEQRALAQDRTQDLGLTLRRALISTQARHPRSATVPHLIKQVIAPGSVSVEWDDQPGFRVVRRH